MTSVYNLGASTLRFDIEFPLVVSWPTRMTNHNTVIIMLIEKSIGPAHETLGLIAFSSNKDSGEPAPMRRLDRVFVTRMHKICMHMSLTYAEYASSVD